MVQMRTVVGHKSGYKILGNRNLCQSKESEHKTKFIFVGFNTSSLISILEYDYCLDRNRTLLNFGKLSIWIRYFGFAPWICTGFCNWIEAKNPDPAKIHTGSPDPDHELELLFSLEKKRHLQVALTESNVTRFDSEDFYSNNQILRIYQTQVSTVPLFSRS
jgi:hypothetical protein